VDEAADFLLENWPVKHSRKLTAAVMRVLMHVIARSLAPLRVTPLSMLRRKLTSMSASRCCNPLVTPLH